MGKEPIHAGVLDAVYVKSDGVKLEVYLIRSEPIMVVTTVNKRNPVPAALNQIMSMDSGRELVRTLLENGQGKRTK